METTTFFRISNLYGITLVLLGAAKVETNEVVWLAVAASLEDLRKIMMDYCEIDPASQTDLLAKAKEAGLPDSNHAIASVITTWPLSQALMVGHNALFKGGDGTDPDEIATQAAEEAAADAAVSGAKDRAEQAIAKGDAEAVEAAVEDEGATPDPLRVGLLFASGAKRGAA